MTVLVIWLPFHPTPTIGDSVRSTPPRASAALSHSPRLLTSRSRRSDAGSAVRLTRQVFGARWRTAWCISYYESRHFLGARNGANLGPWQINVTAHPWVNARLLTRSWLYSAKIAYRVSRGGTDWSAWTTHSSCGV